MARRWPWKIPPNDFYEPGEGGTGWVIQNGKPLHMSDMGRYEEDREYYDSIYPGFECTDRFQIRAQVRHLFNLKTEEVFPLSYACVPIMGKQKSIGALRCCISRNGPYHVDEDVLNVLQAVAMRLSDWLRHWFREQRQHADKSAATTIMSSLGQANRFAMDRWDHPDAKDRVISYLLRICKRSIPQATAVQIWLEDPDGKTLREVTGVTRDDGTEPRTIG